MARTKEQQAQDKLDAAKASLIPAKTVVAFEIIQAFDGMSKGSEKSASVDMTTLVIKLFHDDQEITVRDYMGFWNRGDEKILQFCEATGLDYNDYAPTDTVPPSQAVEGLTGYLSVKVGKPSGDYAAKNEVAFYVPCDDETKLKVQKVKESVTVPSDEDIPF